MIRMWVYFGDLGGALDLRSVDVSRLPFLKGTVERGGGVCSLGWALRGLRREVHTGPCAPWGVGGQGRQDRRVSMAGVWRRPPLRGRLTRMERNLR